MEGRAIITKDSLELDRVGPGAYFGELAILDGEPRSATVVADTDMELLVLDSREFRRLIEASPTIAWKILATMAERLRQADEAISY